MNRGSHGSQGRTRRFAGLLIPAVSACLLVAQAGSAGVPDGTLSVAYQRPEKGKQPTDNGTVWYETLECQAGACKLATVVLSPCAEGGFLMTAVTRTTNDGTLSVKALDDQTLRVESHDSTTGVTINRNYVFRTLPDISPGRPRTFMSLSGFSGAGVAAPGGKFEPSWTLTPLKGAFVPVNRSCKPVVLSIVP